MEPSSAMDPANKRSGASSYDEYVLAMKRVHRESLIRESAPMQMPRERHRNLRNKMNQDSNKSSTQQTRISIIASMVPDEIIYKQSDYSIRPYEIALMFIDVSGFTDLCENYTKAGRGGPSKMTQILNSYIGAMVQEILTHGGDVLKFSGDAFLAMWKRNQRFTMQDAVHTAIDCGLNIQRNYGTYVTDAGVVLKVKVAISAGPAHFSIIGWGGSSSQCHYVIVGQPVWDVKMAEYMSNAGDVLTTASVWTYVNEGDYCTEPNGDGKHTKVLGVGATWKRFEKLDSSTGKRELDVASPYSPSIPAKDGGSNPEMHYMLSDHRNDGAEINYKEFSLRPSVVAAMRSTWWQGLRRFMVTPVLRAVDTDEPVDFLTEVRRVVVVFVNIVTNTLTTIDLIGVVDRAYKCMCSLSLSSGGLVNKVSMFDKDMMFLIVFGLRGLKHEYEAQMALEYAHHLKEKINEDAIKTVSIGVTSGTTYCGVLGHFLRREYTVISSAVNKANRLMMSYPNIITCDKETFLRSKLDQELFRSVDSRPMKGIANPGPIYEFNKKQWSERLMGWRHPILGRNDELQKYNIAINNALKQYNQRFTKYRDHQFGVAVIGPKMVGKKRFMDECINNTPMSLPLVKIKLIDTLKVPYGLIHLLTTKAYTKSVSEKDTDRIAQDKFESKIRASMDITSLIPLEIHALNTIFNCRFPLPEKFVFEGDLLDEYTVRHVVQEILKEIFKVFCLVAVDEIHHADDESWRVLLIMLDSKFIFLIMTLPEHTLSSVAQRCLENHMIVKIPLGGVDRWYHAALACQLLDVQAIPTDLEKIIQSASFGMPGWIQNYVISLVQRSDLSIVTTSRSEAQALGAVLPAPGLLQRKLQASQDGSSMLRSGTSITVSDSEIIQMAVLAETYNFDNMKVDMTVDATILKTYDSLNSFEKMILKCSSVLGDVFSRRMLMHLLRCDSPRKVAEAIEKLFSIRVLECEGGDFTRDTSFVLVNPAPSILDAKPPFCTCLGTRQPHNCRDLPRYAFCGYMKFKHSLFRSTTYELLTENNKQELHARVMLYLERYTKRCVACGSGNFISLLGQRANDGLKKETDAMRHIRQQIQALSAETRVITEQPSSFELQKSSSEMLNVPGRKLSVCVNEEPIDLKHLRESTKAVSEEHVRSFSSLRLDSCECVAILLSAYGQLIDHCRGAVAYEKLFEAYLEFAYISKINMNIPQAIRLLYEVEHLVKSDKFAALKVCETKWYVDYLMARILSARGDCMLISGELTESRKNLLDAMKLFYDPFPTTKLSVRSRSLKASFHQTMALYLCPSWYIARDSGLIGSFYENIATTLNRLFRLFTECKEVENAKLAAKWSLNYALRTDANFRLLCISYSQMIDTYRRSQNFSRCLKLQRRAMEMCYRKTGHLDITEVQPVFSLYTNIFLFYTQIGNKKKCFEVGITVMQMMTNISHLSNLPTRQMLLLTMLKFLLTELRIQEMVGIMREYFFYMSDHYEPSSETWYYCYAMVILLDTGYTVESYQTCEQFYIKKRDAILRSKTPEAAWNFFVTMWLITIRVGVWERSIMWEDKIKQIQTITFEKHEFSMMILIRLVEGLLITMVNEMDNRNFKKIILLEKTIKAVFREMQNTSIHVPTYMPKYYLMQAYFNYIKRKRTVAYKFLDKASESSKQESNAVVLVWVDHTRNHWNGTLNPMLARYWCEHIEPDCVLDYRSMDHGKIVPYTLPLPVDMNDL